jgi:hypothetical protein
MRRSVSRWKPELAQLILYAKVSVDELLCRSLLFQHSNKVLGATRNMSREEHESTQTVTRGP